MSERDVEQRLEWFLERLGALRQEIGTVIVGQREIVDGALTALLAGSHVLLEGVPGLGKTLLVRTLAQVTGLEWSRIQFTPDLMPADIVGTEVLETAADGKQRVQFRKGPVFAQVVLADEVNRATPKTQSALLEAMQERRVTVSGSTHELGAPYFVLATQNPLEMEGTYPLPEAQLDRFFYKLRVPFPTREELHEIVDRTTAGEWQTPRAVVGRDELLELQSLVRKVPVARPVQDYAIRLLQATHPETPGSGERIRRFVSTGASPRGAQALLLAARIRALFDGRVAPGIEDVRAVALPALRHRILINFEGEAEGVGSDTLIGELLRSVPEAA